MRHWLAAAYSLVAVVVSYSEQIEQALRIINLVIAAGVGVFSLFIAIRKWRRGRTERLTTADVLDEDSRT